MHTHTLASSPITIGLLSLYQLPRGTSATPTSMWPYQPIRSSRPSPRLCYDLCTLPWVTYFLFWLHDVCLWTWPLHPKYAPIDVCIGCSITTCSWSIISQLLVASELSKTTATVPLTNQHSESGHVTVLLSPSRPLRPIISRARYVSCRQREHREKVS